MRLILIDLKIFQTIPSSTSKSICIKKIECTDLDCILFIWFSNNPQIINKLATKKLLKIILSLYCLVNSSLCLFNYLATMYVRSVLKGDTIIWHLSFRKWPIQMIGSLVIFESFVICHFKYTKKKIFFDRNNTWLKCDNDNAIFLFKIIIKTHKLCHIN